MNILINRPEVWESRECNDTDEIITVSINCDDLKDTSKFTVVAQNQKETIPLLEYIANSYFDYRKVFAVNLIEEASAYFDACIKHNFEIKVQSSDETIKPKNEIDKSLARLRVVGVDQYSINRTASKLVGNIGLNYSREEAIADLKSSNALITNYSSEIAIDSAITNLSKRVKESKSVLIKTVKVKDHKDALAKIEESQGGIHLLKIPTGGYKTWGVMYPAYKANEAKGGVTEYVTFRRSIVRSTMQCMTHYKHIKPLFELKVNTLRVVVNSLRKPNITTFTNRADLLLIDEAQQTLNHIVNCRLNNEDHRLEIFNAFLEAIKGTDKVIMADADINQALIECIRLSGRQDITVYEQDIDHSDIKVVVKDLNVVKEEFYQAVKNGEKVLLATDNAGQADGIYENLKRQYRDKAILLLTKECIEDKEQKEFLLDPNNHNYDVIIYSPVIQSSVSITKPYFTSYFALFEGVLLPSSGIQMMRRDRTALLFTVGLKNPKYRNYSAENKDQYLAQFKDVNGFDHISAMLDADSLYLRSHFVAAMIETLKVDKFNVVIGDVDKGKEARGKKAKAIEDNLSKEKYVSGILDALEKADEQFVIRKTIDAESSTGSYYQTELARLQEFYRRPVIDADDIALFERGGIIERLVNIKLAKLDLDAVLVLKGQDDKKYLKYRKHPLIRSKIFELIFDTLNIDIETGEGVFTNSDARKLLCLIHKKSNQFSKISGHIQVTDKWKNSTQPVRTVNQILYHFFRLKTDRVCIRENNKRVNKYFLNKDKFAIMKKLLDNVTVN